MQRSTLWRLLTVLVVLAMVLGSIQFLLATPTTDAGKPRYSLVKDAEGNPATRLADKPVVDDTVRVFVRLSDPPLALYKGGIDKIPAPSLTARKKLDLASPAAKAYLSYLEGKQATFKAALAKTVPSAVVVASTKLATNGLALSVPRKELSKLTKLPGVTRVIMDRKIPLDLDTLHSVHQTAALWTAVGGQSEAGKGIKIALLDTGADPDAPMYDDTGYIAPPGYPRGDLRYTNNKLIVARAYPWPGGPIQSALDEGGHSTFIGGVAGGSAVQATYAGMTTNVSGVAPGAYIMTYNVAADPATASLIIVTLAFDDIIADDADVVNMSYSGMAGPIELDWHLEPMNSLIAAGIVPVAAIGNSGPTAETAQHSPGTLPNVIGVGATDNARFLANAKLDVTAPAPVPGNLTNVAASEAEFTAPFTTVGPAEYVYVGLACSPIADDLTGKIALIARGACTFVTKVGNARNKGAIGAVVYNNVAGGPPIAMGGSLTPSIPAIMVGNADGLALRDFVTANPGAQLQFASGVAASLPLPTQSMVSFSGRGPGSLFQIKPDVVAVGADILSQCQNNNPAGFACYAADYWVTGQGTRYSTPVVVGAVALLKQLHPDWTPAQIKSALMTTANQNVFNDYAHTSPASITSRGAGEIDLSKAGDPGLTFDKPSHSFGIVNLANQTGVGVYATTITATDVRMAGAGDFMYNLTVTEMVGAAGFITVTVSPDMLTFGSAGATNTFTLQAEVAPDTPAGIYSGWVNIGHGPHQNHIVYWLRVINKDVTGNVLVVDDDRNGEEYGGTYDASGYFADALTNLGETFTIWNTSTYGPPSLADMQKANVVVWMTGLDFYSSLTYLPTLTAVELQALYDYLAAGGRVLVTGQDLLSSSVYWDEGLAAMLHADLLQDSIYDPDYAGNPPPRPSMTSFVNNPVTGNDVFDINWDRKADGNWPDGFGGEFATDEGWPRGREGAFPILTTQGTPPGAMPLGIGAIGIAASSEPDLTIPQAYTGRTVWLGFGLENVNNDTGFNTREDLLGGILTWLRDEVSGSLTSSLAVAGQTSVFTVTATSTLGEPIAYVWDFGDGYDVTTTDRNWAPHVFRAAGQYTVRVLVTDSLQHTTIVSQTVTILAPTPDLSTSTKSVNKATASPEEKVTYTLTMRNTGTGPATDPWIIDVIPAGTTYVDGSATGGAVYDAASNSIKWGGVGLLPVGGERTITFQVRVNDDTAVGAEIVNTAVFKDVPTAVEVSRSATTNVVPQPVISPAVMEDTYIYQWVPNANYGADGRLFVRAADVQASLLKLDLSALPLGATIKKAELKLYATGRTNVGPTEVGVFQMLAPWAENEATWNLASAGVAWEAAGANGAGDRSATPATTQVLTTAAKWYTFDIKTIAQNWANGDANNGLVIKYVNGDVMVAYSFGSSEYFYANLRPVVSIQYVNP